MFDTCKMKRPHVGVGVVVWRGEKVLLIRRGKEPRKGEWSIPGGSQELGETLQEAACREVYEETRLVIEIDRIVDVLDGLIRDDGGNLTHHYTLIDFVAYLSQGDPVAGDDATEARWFELADLPTLNLHAETLRVIRASKLPGSSDI